MMLAILRDELLPQRIDSLRVGIDSCHPSAELRHSMRLPFPYPHA